MYDSDWMVANATIENLFQLQHPLPNFKSIDQYWYEAGKAATGVADLEFSGEEVVVNYIIQTLPEYFKAMLETQLKIRFPGKYKFSRVEVEEAYMHSIGSGNRNTSQIIASVEAFCAGIKNKSDNKRKKGGTQDSSQPEQPVQTLQSQPQPNQNQHNRETDNQYNAGGQSRGGGRGGRGRGSNGGGGRGRGRGQFTRTCQLCNAEGHGAWRCASYPTVNEVRIRLVGLGLCQACATPINEHGDSCSAKAACYRHSGQRHWSWTCDGQEHPGYQGRA